jgi:hypothetical protein
MACIRIEDELVSDCRTGCDVNAPIAKPARGTAVLPAVLLFFAACAKVGDPLPPVVQPPETTQKLLLVQIGQTARLFFPPPVPDIRFVEVHRGCGAAGEWEPKRKPEARVDAKSLAVAPDSASCFIDDSPAAPGCRYAIRLVNSAGRRSAFSNEVRTSPALASAPPLDLKCEVRKDAIVVTWRPPKKTSPTEPEILGYLVNSKHRVAATRFEDLEFEFGKPRVYQVQAVTREDNPFTLSEFSAPLEVVPQDTFGPEAPKNLIALTVEGEVRLVWDAPPDVDLKGYWLYRGVDPERLEKAPDLLLTNNCTQKAPPDGVVFYCQVSAVDLLGNESPRSELLRVEAR